LWVLVAFVIFILVLFIIASSATVAAFDNVRTKVVRQARHREFFALWKTLSLVVSTDKGKSSEAHQ
jgi:hypothetical protein